MKKINKKIKKLERKKGKLTNKINKLESKYNYLTSNEGIDEFIRKNGEKEARLLLIPVLFALILAAVSSQIIQYTVIPFCIACTMGTIGLGYNILYLDTMKRAVSDKLKNKVKKLILKISKLKEKTENINNQLAELDGVTNNENNNITQIAVLVDKKEPVASNNYIYLRQDKQDTMSSITKSLAAEDINYIGWNKNDREKNKPIVRKKKYINVK